MTLSVKTVNRHTIALYQRHGFVDAGLSPHDASEHQNVPVSDRYTGPSPLTAVRAVHWPDLASRRSLRCEYPEEPLCENLVDGHGGGQLWGRFQAGFVGQWVRQARHSDQFDIVRVRVLRA